tara:strand:+ start:422 stop:958 length:537 start_codon:yes stop_codon:yes gene_type:complete
MKLLDEMKQYFEEKKSKPDFLDIDGDGNKKEPMKKAVKDKEDDIEEANVTGNLDGGEGPPRTPKAFKKKKKKDIEESSERQIESVYKKMMATMEELQEVSYRDYKKDPTSTPQQKVNRGIMEVNRMLSEMEKIVTNNLRLKTETGMQSGHFWKATGKRFAKINERMLRVAHRLKELSS